MVDFALPLLAIVGGVVLLVKGGDVLVTHAARLATSYHVPKTVIGAVILGFGTSLPELFVSLTAALEKAPGIALGNVVGSNIANVGLILGVGAFVHTLHVPRSVVRVDLPMGLITALCLYFLVGDVIDARIGGFLLVAFALYLTVSLMQTRRFRNSQRQESDVPRRLAVDMGWILGGLIVIGGGAHFLVWGAERIVLLLEVSGTLIGLTVVALGTSLPELAAIYAAAKQGETELAVGNVAGSNLFNILFILGTTSLVTDIPVGESMHAFDFPVLIVFSVIAFPLLARERRIRRAQGVLMLGGYCTYIIWTWLART